MRLTQAAGWPSHLGALEQAAFWPLPEATESTCPHSSLQSLPARGKRFSFLMSQATLADPGPAAGLQEPITKGKIIRG